MNLLFRFLSLKSVTVASLFKLASLIRYKTIVNKADTKVQLKITIPTKYQGINAQPMKVKTQIHSHINIHTRNITNRHGHY